MEGLLALVGTRSNNLESSMRQVAPIPTALFRAQHLNNELLQKMLTLNTQAVKEDVNQSLLGMRHVFYF